MADVLPVIRNSPQWAPVEHTRRAHRQAQDARCWPKQRALISVHRDTLVRLATIDVRHALVEVILPGHIEKRMDPIRQHIARDIFSVLNTRFLAVPAYPYLQSQDPAVLWSVLYHLRDPPALDHAGPFLMCNGNQGVLQCLMPEGTVINWQGTTHHIPTTIQPLCMVRHACALEDIHNTAFAKYFPKLRQQVWNRKA